MSFLDESAWRDKVYSSGGIFASGTGARFGGTANLDAFTDTRWAPSGARSPYPF